MQRTWRKSVRALLVRWGVKHRSRVQAGIDAAAWGLALVFATVVRWNFDFGKIDYAGLVAIIPLAVLAQIVAGLGSGLYTGRWRFGSFEEVAAVARAAATTTALLFAVDLWVTDVRMVPLSAALAGGVVAFALMGGARYVWRLALESRRRPSSSHAARLLVFGAGDGAAQVIQ